VSADEVTNTPWAVSNCGNPNHGPEWECHRVTDSTGARLLSGVALSVAERYASLPSLREQVRALTQQLADEEDEVGLKQAALNGAYEQVRSLNEQLANLASTALGERETARKKIAALTNERDTLAEQLATTHGQVAEVARLLDPDVTPDAWGLHAAAQKRMGEVRALTADNAAKDKAFSEYVYERGVEHEDAPGTDVACPEDDTCECPRIVALNAAFGPERPGAAMLAEMEELRRRVDEYGFALHGTSVFVGPCVHERDPWDRCDECGEGSSVQALMKVANALRARVAELEAMHTADTMECANLRERAEHFSRACSNAESERDAARKRAKALEASLRDLLASADCEWENRRGGHDWADACQQAREVLDRKNTPEEG